MNKLIYSAIVLWVFMAACTSKTEKTAPPLFPAGSAANLPDLVISLLLVQVETGGGCLMPEDSTWLGLGIYVENQGKADAGAFTVTVKDLEPQEVAGLAAGESTRLWFATGQTNVTLDEKNVIPESDETNNHVQDVMLPIPTLPATCPPTPTAYPSSLPDLMIVSLVVQVETGNACMALGASTHLGLGIIVKNQGTTDAGTFTVTVNDLEPREVAGLAAGESTRLWFATGGYQPNVTLDGKNVIAESDETNNHLQDMMLQIPTLPPMCTTTPP